MRPQETRNDPSSIGLPAAAGPLAAPRTTTSFTV
jgi:hypothetical protein